jgi:hypothetical protein
MKVLDLVLNTACIIGVVFTGYMIVCAFFGVGL